MDRAARSRWLDAAARLGLASRGLVHLVIGALAARMALGHGGRALGTRDAVFVIGRIGTVPLIVLIVGLCGYGAWRLVQTFADTEGKGRSLGGILLRIGFALNGAFYFGLVPVAVKLAIGARVDPRDPTRETAHRILAYDSPGRVVLGVLGVLLIYSAFAQWVETVRAQYAEDFDGASLSRFTRWFFVVLGRFGIGLRAIIFAVMGVWLVRAAVHQAPHEAKGLGESFASLRAQPYGPYLFATVAVGVLAYAWFSIEYAHHRRIGPT